MQPLLVWAFVCAGASPAVSNPCAPSALSLRADPFQVVLGSSGPQNVQLVMGVPPEAGAPLADSTAGDIGPLEALEPGVFHATLSRPVTAHPQVAVVSITVPGNLVEMPPCVATAFVSFAAQIALQGKTEPGASMRLTVGGRSFGPVTADAGGAFTLPIVVPPGEGSAEAVSTDALGNASRSRIDLYLPQVQRLHAFVFPGRCLVDGEDRGWVFVATVSAVGAPEDSPITAEAALGSLPFPPVRVRPGLWRLEYRPPNSLDKGEDAVRVQGRGGARLTIPVPLVAGPPARLTVHLSPPRPPADGNTTTTVRIEARDAQGNATHAAVLVALDGEPLPAAASVPGLFEARLPPRSRMGSAHLEVRATAPTGACAARRPSRHGMVDPEGRLCQPPTAVTVAQDVQWVLPSAVSLGLRAGERRGTGWVVVLTSRGLDPQEVAARLRMQASAGAILTALPAEGGAARWLLQPADNRGPIDVVATDEQSGVSAWLRLKP